jgi:hypothetical protein
MNKYKAFSKQSERREYQMCVRKKPFNTRSEAETQKGAQVYKCFHCGKWHRSLQLTKLINKVSQ